MTDPLVQLGQLADLNPEALGAKTAPDLEFDYIDLSSVSRGYLDRGLISRYRFQDAPSRARRIVRPGDVLFGTVRPQLQSHALVRTDGAVASTGFCVVRPRRGVSDGSFLGHFLLSDQARRQASRLEVGSNYPAVTESDVAAFRLQAFSLEEQRRIAKILDTADETIQATEHVIAKLEQAARGLIRSELEGLGGKWFPLGQLARFSNGFSFPADSWTDSGYPIIRIQNLNGSTEFNHYSGSPQESWRVRPGDLLFAWSGMRETSFGPSLWSGPEGVLNQHIFRVEPDGDIVDKRFLYLLLDDQKLGIADLAHGFKDSFVHVTRRELTSYKVRVPSIDQQRRLVEASEASSLRLEVERSSLGKLCRIRQGIATDLLCGRVRTVVA